MNTLLLIPLLLTLAGPKLMPVDEAPNDPSLVAFRNELLDAVRRRDVDAIVALSDPKIGTSAGEGKPGGVARLRLLLRHDEVMEDLERLLTQGGKFRRNGEFMAPYVSIAWPHSHAAFPFLAVTGENIPLRDFPEVNAPVLATLSYDIVERKEKKGEWQQVKTADGHTGWVEASAVRSAILDFRAAFKKIDGRWKMTALVSGD
jgi:hypothetical protein